MRLAETYLCELQAGTFGPRFLPSQVRWSMGKHLSGKWPNQNKHIRCIVFLELCWRSTQQLWNDCRRLKYDSLSDYSAGRAHFYFKPYVRLTDDFSHQGDCAGRLGAATVWKEVNMSSRIRVAKIFKDVDASSTICVNDINKGGVTRVQAFFKWFIIVNEARTSRVEASNASNLFSNDGLGIV